MFGLQVLPTRVWSAMGYYSRFGKLGWAVCQTWPWSTGCHIHRITRTTGNSIFYCKLFINSGMIWALRSCYFLYRFYISRSLQHLLKYHNNMTNVFWMHTRQTYKHHADLFIQYFLSIEFSLKQQVAIFFISFLFFLI